MWAASHLVFAGCMVGSFFTHSVAGATLLIACTGFSWGVTQWAPFSLLAEAILTAPASTPGRGSVAIRLADTRTGIRAEEVNEEEEGFLVSRPGEESDSEDEEERRGLGKAKAVRESDDGSESDGDIEFVRPDEDGVYPPKRPIGHRRGNSALLLGNPAAQLSVVDVLTPREAWGEDEDRGGGGGMREARDAELGLGAGRGRGRGGDGDGEGREEEGGALSSKAGVILGIHNIFIVIPQFLVTGLSAAIFAIFDGEAAPPGHAPAPEGEGVSRRNSVVYVFRIGGIWASIAFVLAWRLARELRRR
ncbi:hypothetical protein DFH08DRAFT_517151 [Mycena albidolilacea]|uniref:Uncharacterized protein n=1 Tax=Mycena albidolilacea TaxID=1033008 RepID=A0AAD7E9S0_9AGAR|nr:hypothetical protein DFH08DRAFT_517151 [Mycena albidolilacea]